jgi:hypothetical protein
MSPIGLNDQADSLGFPLRLLLLARTLPFEQQVSLAGSLRGVLAAKRGRKDG